MKTNYLTIIGSIILILQICSFTSYCQQSDLNEKIDSLVNVIIKERRQWNQASEMLIEIGEPAVNALLELLNDKKAPSWPRRKAAQTLKDIGSQKIIESCLTIYKDTTEEVSVRINASNALSQVDLGNYEDVFLEMANDENSRIRNAAYLRLGCIGTKSALQPLIGVANNSTGNSLWALLISLEPSDAPEVDQIFINTLFKHTWWEINALASKSLMRRGVRIIPQLTEVLHNKGNSDFVRWRAIWIIKQIDFPDREKLVSEFLNDESWVVRNEAEVALSEF